MCSLRSTCLLQTSRTASITATVGSTVTTMVLQQMIHSGLFFLWKKVSRAAKNFKQLLIMQEYNYITTYILPKKKIQTKISPSYWNKTHNLKQSASVLMATAADNMQYFSIPTCFINFHLKTALLNTQNFYFSMCRSCDYMDKLLREPNPPLQSPHGADLQLSPQPCDAMQSGWLPPLHHFTIG